MDRGFRFHEHTADITVECWAPSLEEAFSEGALATFEVILNTSTVEPKASVDVNARGVDLKELLVEWIGKLIALVDINGHFYCRFDVDAITRDGSEWVLTGRAWGEEIDLEKHDARTEVKAMTYADLRIDLTDDRTTIWFTLDI